MNRRLPLFILWVGLPTLAVAAPAAGDDVPLPDAGDVIRRFVESSGRVATNAVAGAFIFYRTNITEEFNRKGKLAEREEMLLRVTVDGSDKEVELVSVNGRPPTDKERERELRRFGGRRDNATRRERPDRSRSLDAYLTLEVLSRYVFTVDAREEVAGRLCLKVSFKPGGTKAKSDKLFERVLDALTGIFWIDAEDYQLAKADVQLGEKVSLWGGMLGGLEELRLQIDRTRNAAGHWRDQAVEARFVGRAVTRHIDIRTRDLSSPPVPVEPPPVVAAD